MSKKKIPQRFGAAALATATVVSGLAFGPGAVAAPAAALPTVANTADETQDTESTRRVGPLVMANTEAEQYGLRLDPDTLRTTTTVGDASYVSVPDVGEQGQVRGTGANSDRCLITTNDNTYMSVTTCSDSATQLWTWVDTAALQGFDKTLAPVAASSKGLTPRGAGTYLSLTSGAGTRPLVMDDTMLAERELTAEVEVDGALASISGVGTTGATVSAREESVEVAADGTYELSFDDLPVGTTSITVTQTLPNGDVQGTETVDVVIESIRMVGPLAIVESETNAFGLRGDADTMRTASGGTLAEAQASADFWSMPALGRVGPVRGVGAKADRCLTKPYATDGAVTMAGCNGSAQQNWQWTDTTTLQGFSKALSPSSNTQRAIAPRGAGTYVHAVDGATSKRPMVLDAAVAAERAFTAVAAVDAVSRSATLSGTATAGSTVSALGESVVVSPEGTFSLPVSDLAVGTTTIEVVQTLPNGDAFGTTTVDVEVAASAGPIAPVEVGAVELARGAETVVSAEVLTSSELTSLDSTVTFTAPEGTTFANAADRAVSYLRPGGEWTPSAYLGLTGGVLSDDAKTLTYTANVTQPNFGLEAGSKLRLSAVLATSAGAVDAEGLAMSFVHSGTANSGAFRATGTAPVSIPGDYGHLTASPAEAVEAVRGTVVQVPAMFENVSGTNVRGAIEATVVVTAPEGSTFVEGQTAVPFQYRPGGTGSWSSYARMDLSGVTLSDDRRTLTATVSTDSAKLDIPERYRYVFSVEVADDAPDSGELAFVFQNSAAENRFRVSTTTPVSAVSAYTPVTLGNLADGDTFTPGDVTFSGTGTPGATVTVSPSTGAGVTTEVREDGTWSAVRYLGNAAYTMSVSQVAASGANTIEKIRLYSDAVSEEAFSVTSPVTGAGHAKQGWVTFTGVGTTWSTVSISDGSSVAPSTATVQYDGTWSTRRWVGTEKTTFTVTSSRADVQNGTQTIEFNTGVSGQAFSLDSHTDGGTFTPGNVVFSGKGSTGDKVTLTAPGLAPLEATVDATGTWSIPRWLGNGFITFTVTHTPVTGEAKAQTLRLFSDRVAQGDLVVTAPVDGAGHEQPGWVTFTGTGTTWSKVSISDDTSAAPSTATVQIDGSWTVRRWVGTTATTFTVSSERAGIANGSKTIEFNVGEATDDFTIGSHTDGGTFTPGNVAITGTGTTGDKVTITAPGLPALETEVDARGRWSIQRWLGNGFITFTVTHTPVTGDETKQTLRLFSDQVAQGDLVVTTPKDGDSHTAPGFVTFTGTGTTWSKVSISDGTSVAPSTATVQYDGSWTVRRWVGTAPVTFTVTSQRADIANGSETIRFNTAD